MSDDLSKTIWRCVAVMFAVLVAGLSGCDIHKDWHNRKMAELGFCWTPIPQTNREVVSSWQKCRTDAPPTAEAVRQ